ncbi:MAG TPA: polysaccharide pyruvyl transferase family protein [Rhizomicrobium sp.]|nr:polysaccharide pyruvyl transferase family protein [Rhizomicrobium sp.]
MDNGRIIERANALICEQLDPLLRDATELSLLDFPNHGNVGDSAIWAGQLAYLGSRNQLPHYVSSRDTIDWNAVAALQGPILLCGGGNFGDIWPGHQEFRTELITRFPNRKIIQLPQSIEFASPSEAEKARNAIHSHPDFTLFVRDKRSMERARTLLNVEPILIPDMAFCLGKISRRRPPNAPLLLLLRADKERKEHTGTNLSIPGHIEDWLKDQKGFYKWSQLKARLSTAHCSKVGYQFALLEQLANARLKRGLAMLAKYEFVITDRLHCHILCLLQDIPHVAMDNSYGKIDNFIKAWTADYDQLGLADNLKQAVQYYHRRTTSAVEPLVDVTDVANVAPPFAYEEPTGHQNG